MSSKRDIWIPIYIADFIADTSHLDAARSGCYLLWIMHYWRRGPLSGNLADLAAIGRLRGNDAPSIAQALLDEFFTVGSDSLWHQKRLDAEINRWQTKSLSNKEKASKAARERWKNHKRKDAPSNAPSNAPKNAPAMLEDCQSPSTLSSPLRSEDKGFTPPSPSGAPAPNGQPGAPLETPAAATPASVQNGSPAPSDELGDATGLLIPIDTPIPPKKKIAHGVTNGAQPKKRKDADKAEKDARHVPFKDEIFEYWTAQNPSAGKCPWNGAEAGSLDELLSACPDMTLDTFVELLRNRAQSDVNPAERPSIWIRNLMNFSAGPLDRYGKLAPAPRRL